MACGKCEHLQVVAIIPAQSTETVDYTGPCASTYNKEFTEYEIQWSNGDCGCWSVSDVIGHIQVGDDRCFCK